MNNLFSILIISSIISFISCTKDADVKLPAVEPKLVISSFISPQDSIVKVEVTMSQPLYNNSNAGQFSAVSNATVQINDGTITQTLAYDSTGNYYFVNTSLFPITVGTIYYLTVLTPDGKNINASTTVPTLNSTLTYTSHQITDPYGSEKYVIETSWNDTPDTEDYYRIAFYNKDYYPGDIDTTYWALLSENFSDKGKDGGAFNQNSEIYTYSSTGTVEGELYLIHASKEYYLFHSKLLDAAYSGSPFSEPVQMYSNINGGYGVFAGYNSYKLLVSL